MTEFRFDIKPLFPQQIVKVSSNLLPHTFRGDRRQVLDATTKISEIIDVMGQLSAVAQKLNTPVTTAQRLRLSENQRIYLMADVNAGHNGMILGLLKVGTKDLYLFDDAGNSRKVDNTPCILDFYIHESRQRSGLGKQLFEVMLAEESWKPINCSIDRPSAKLMGFFTKYYGLQRTIPQANNFVIYEGFFEQLQNTPQTNRTNGKMYITNSPNTQLFGAHFVGGDIKNQTRRGRQNDINNLTAQLTQIAPTGRYGAPRPACSMGEVAPSEMSFRNKSGGDHARKNPLDALSRQSMRQPIERRSGLQEVDDSYLARNVFALSLKQRGQLDDVHPSESNMQNETQQQNQQSKEVPVAGLPSHYQTAYTIQRGLNRYHNQQGQPKVQVQAQSSVTQMQQPQSNIQQQQQQQQQLPQQQQQQQIPQQQQNSSTVVASQIASQHQHQQATSVAQPTQQQQQHVQQQPPQQQQSQGRMPAGYIESSQAEPDMCTTCPNCQATIFLMRNGATPMDTNMLGNQDNGNN